MNPDFCIPLVAAPITTLAVVLIGYIVQNQNLNAGMAELRSDMNARFGDMNVRFGDMNARFGDTNKRIDDVSDLLRAEMTKNHSELLHKFADLDSCLTKLEQHR